MPKINGFEAVRTILYVDPEAVIALTSMKEGEEYESLAKDGGAAVFYSKQHLDVGVVRDLIEQHHHQILAE